MKFWNSTIGKKIVVALTGLILFGFVVGHLIGNLQVFLGSGPLNDYAEFLQHKTHGALWVARAVMLTAVILHIMGTVQLNRRNRASRPIPYAKHEIIQAPKSSLLMIWSGIFLAIYILYHISHLTLGWTHPGFSRSNVYANVIIGFSSWPASITYIFAMAALGLHLHHGISSLFQTLGLNHPKYNAARRGFAVGASIFIAVGYSLIPIAVLTGLLHL